MDAKMTDAERQADNIGSWKDAIGTLRKLEIMRTALVRIRTDSANRGCCGAMEGVHRIARDALIEVE
jgi:hypothetical protein